MARGDVEPWHLGGLFLEEKRHHPGDGHSPDDQTSEGSPPQSPPGEGLHGIHHSQEPVNADDCHEHDGGVHVTVKRCRDEATHFRPKFPITSRKVVADLKGEYRHKQHICCGQV